MAEEIDGVRTTVCETWEEFCAAARKTISRSLTPIFRGHASCDWALVPPIERDQYAFRATTGNFAPNWPSAHASMGQWEYFKHLATGLPGVDLTKLEDIDVQALARHNGLTTNLLDWTYSPYVAAFFAFSVALDRQNEGRVLAGTLTQNPVYLFSDPVCIWCLSLTQKMQVVDEFEIHSSLSPVNHWQKAQAGLFTRLTHPKHRNVVSYLAKRGLLRHLQKFEISGKATATALLDLQSMNISYSTLFPDLRGAAIQANLEDCLKFLVGLPGEP